MGVREAGKRRNRERKTRNSELATNPIRVTALVEPCGWGSPLLGPYPSLRVAKQVEHSAQHRRLPGLRLNPVPDPAAARLHVFQTSWKSGIQLSRGQLGSTRE